MKRIFTLLIIFGINLGALGAEQILQVASYNIKGLPYPIQLKHTSRYKKIVREIKAMENKGEAPDVILVQEAFSVLTNYLYLKLRKIYPYRVRGPGRRIKWNSGLQILSRYPVTKAVTITFSFCDSFDCLARKGVLFTRIRLPDEGGEVDLYNTHMQANNRGRNNAISRNVRSHQTETMVSFIKRTHAEGLPLFIGGDLNMRPQESGFQRLLEEFGDIETRTYCQTRNDCPGFQEMPDNYWNNKIDHILYSSGERFITPLDYEQFFHNRNYSDHDMLKGKYKLNRCPELNQSLRYSSSC